MTIKIRFHGDKAIIRWKHPGEAAFLKQQMTMFRDSMDKTMPISVKDEKGHEVPRMQMPRPSPTPAVIQGTPQSGIMSISGSVESSGADVVQQPARVEQG